VIKVGYNDGDYNTTFVLHMT